MTTVLAACYMHDQDTELLRNVWPVTDLCYTKRVGIQKAQLTVLLRKAPDNMFTFGGFHFNLHDSGVISETSRGPSGLAGLSGMNK